MGVAMKKIADLCRARAARVALLACLLASGVTVAQVGSVVPDPALSPDAVAPDAALTPEQDQGPAVRGLDAVAPAPDPGPVAEGQAAPAN